MTMPDTVEGWIVYLVMFAAGAVVKHYFPALAPLLDRLRGRTPTPAPVNPANPDAPALPAGTPLLDLLRQLLAQHAARRAQRQQEQAEDVTFARIEALIREQGNEPR